MHVGRRDRRGGARIRRASIPTRSGSSAPPTTAAWRPDGLFDARWLDEAVPDRPGGAAGLGLPHGVVQLGRAGAWPASRADTPDPPLGEIPHREDGSVLGTLREWGAVDLVYQVVRRPRPRRRRDRRCGTAADYYLARGVTWVQDAWVEPDDVDTYLEAARRDALRRALQPRRSTPTRGTSTLSSRSSPRRVAASRTSGSPLLTAQHRQVLCRRGRRERDRRAAGAVLLAALPRATACRCGRATRWPRRRAGSTNSGFQIHIHAIGDAAARQALDAIEYASRATARATAGR